MADISKVKIGVSEYDIKDAIARGMIWKGTQAEYETAVATIPAGTVIFITDDGGDVIAVNYVDLTNKPQINGVTLTGNKTGSDLGLVNAEIGKGLSSNDYTANEKSKLAGIASGAQANVIEAITVNGVAQTVTNKTVALTVMTNAVNDLVNYYKKTETYTQAEVNALVGAIPKFAIKVVDALPTTNISTTTVYLLRTSTTETGNLYTEYIYAEVSTGTYQWEMLGTQTLDLSDYITTSDLNTALADYTTTANLAAVATSGSYADLSNTPTLGTAAAKNVPTSGDAATTEVVMGNDSRLSDARTPTSHTHTKSEITDFPTLGTAAAKDVAATGNASTSQVVMGNDTRLTDSRTPTAHTHTTDDITDFWEGTQAEYEEATIANGSIIVITDDDGNGNPINYTSALNKPQVNGVTLTGNKTSSDLGLVSAVSGKGLSTNDYTTAEKNKLASLVASPVKIVTWADGTDAEIAAMVAAAANGSINLRNYWNVGDERVVSLAAMAATGVGESHAAQDVTLVLLNKGGYTDVNGKDVAFVVGLKTQLNEKGYMNSTNTTEGGWGGCARRAWCNSVFYNALPSGLKPIFKQVKVPSFPSQFVIEFNSDYVTLPAPSEIIGHLDSSSWSYEPDTDEFANFCCQFEYYKNVYRANTYNPPSVSSTHYDVWTRAFSRNASGMFFTVSNRGGMAYSNMAYSNDSPTKTWGIQPIMFI